MSLQNYHRLVLILCMYVRMYVRVYKDVLVRRIHINCSCAYISSDSAKEFENLQNIWISDESLVDFLISRCSRCALVGFVKLLFFNLYIVIVSVLSWRSLLSRCLFIWRFTGENWSNSDAAKNNLKRNGAFSEPNATMEVAQLLLSLLHAWGMDPDLDRVCEGKLGLLRPMVPVSFGVLSKGGRLELSWKSVASDLFVFFVRIIFAK